MALPENKRWRLEHPTTGVGVEAGFAPDTPNALVRAALKRILHGYHPQLDTTEELTMKEILKTPKNKNETIEPKLKKAKSI